jgi:hypothetical protein
MNNLVGDIVKLPFFPRHLAGQPSVPDCMTGCVLRARVTCARAVRVNQNPILKSRHTSSIPLVNPFLLHLLERDAYRTRRLNLLIAKSVRRQLLARRDATRDLPAKTVVSEAWHTEIS